MAAPGPLRLDAGPAPQVGGAPKRTIKNLRRARFDRTGKPPRTRSGSASSAASRRGLSFERRVADALTALAWQGHLSNLRLGPWISFEDANGPGRAQPDAVFSARLARGYAVVVAEIKLTETADAWSQLHGLYVPLCEWLFPDAWIVPVQISRGLLPEGSRAAPHTVVTCSELSQLAPDTVWFMPGV